MAPDPARLRRILRQHVQADALLGVEVLPVGADTPPLAPAPPAPPPVFAAKRTPAPATATPVPPEQGKPLIAPPVAPLREPLPRARRIALLTQLDEQEVKGCERCLLAKGRTRTVFGEGNPEARVMFIGEGPGQTEDEQGRPFVGRAGELLNKQIQAIGLEREDVFIANTVKCRPPNNRAPTPQEVDACSDYLIRQIQIICPEVIVTLGGPASKFITGSPDGITRIRGMWHTFDRVEPSIPVMPTFHPAYLLRSYTVENRRKVWEDLKQVAARLGL
jgi:DNA polymerase